MCRSKAAASPCFQASGAHRALEHKSLKLRGARAGHGWPQAVAAVVLRNPLPAGAPSLEASVAHRALGRRFQLVPLGPQPALDLRQRRTGAGEDSRWAGAAATAAARHSMRLPGGPAQQLCSCRWVLAFSSYTGALNQVVQTPSSSPSWRRAATAGAPSPPGSRPAASRGAAWPRPPPPCRPPLPLPPSCRPRHTTASGGGRWAPAARAPPPPSPPRRATLAPAQCRGRGPAGKGRHVVQMACTWLSIDATIDAELVEQAIAGRHREAGQRTAWRAGVAAVNRRQRGCHR